MSWTKIDKDDESTWPPVDGTMLALNHPTWSAPIFTPMNEVGFTCKTMHGISWIAITLPPTPEESTQ